MGKALKSGTIVKTSAQYELIGRRGGHTGLEVTGVKGKPLPPTPKTGMSFELKDATRHKKSK